MKYKIYFEYKDGTQDYMFISGDTIEEIRKKAHEELNKRGVKGLTSEKVEDI
jgi:hypothetical protein